MGNCLAGVPYWQFATDWKSVISPDGRPGYTAVILFGRNGPHEAGVSDELRPPKDVRHARIPVCVGRRFG